MLQTVAVTCTAYDQNGDPVSGGRVVATLDQTEIDGGFVVPERVEGITDAQGVCVLQLWPNALGVTGSSYLIRAWNPDTGKRYLDARAVVPNSACRLEDIIVQEPFPAIDAAEQALIAAQGALAPVTAQAAIAVDAADDAQASATAAAASEGSAATSAATATSQASTATAKAAEAATSASTASTQAGIATTAANTATAQAQTASTQAASAVTKAEEALAAQTGAAASAASASSSATTATTQAATATAQATTATNQAAVATSQANSAATSASQANTSANAAAGSATAAANSASAAAGSATSASSSASAAAASNTSAGVSASTATAAAATATAKASEIVSSSATASTQAGIATTKASEAATSASTATNQASTATTKASESSASAAAATTKAGEALASATAAAGSASAADIDAQATAADRLQTGLNAAATADDRVQTGLDAVATAADRVQTGLDRTAAQTSASSAAASEVAASEFSDTAQAWAASPVDVPVVEGATPEANEYSALHWAAKAEVSQGIAGSFASSAVDARNAAQQAANNAVAVVTGGTASLSAAAGRMPIAGASAVLDETWTNPIPGVAAAALHRSPNAVTAMFIYDTSKDSDGGAWTEKCQGTSWYNEAISGKWLGAHSSESTARLEGATLGSELVTNGGFDADANWTKGSEWAISNGSLSVTATGAFSSTHQSITFVSGKRYQIEFDFYITNNPSSNIFFRLYDNTTSGQNLGSVNAASTFRVRLSFIANSTSNALRVRIEDGATGSSARFDNVSVKEVIAQTTQTGDYFQLTTDGKFYRLNATSGTTETFRGNKRDFPRLAGIVTEAARTTIYDLTEPGRPMWRSFTSSACTGVFAINGWLVRAQANTPVIDYVRDRSFNAGGSDTINAVSGVVLATAPVDPVTGLKTPTLAIARSTGLSIRQNSGTLVNSSSTSSFDRVTITPQLLTASRADAVWYYAYNPSLLGASFALATVSASINEIARVNGARQVAAGRADLVRSSTGANFQKIRHHEATPTRSAVATITSTFNTGHMTGDVRRAYLADIDAGSVSGTLTEVIASADNREFNSNTGYWALEAGWSISNGQAIFSGSLSSITRSSGGLVAGNVYLCTVDVASKTGNVWINIGDNHYNGGVLVNAGVNSFYFVARGQRIGITADAAVSINSISYQLVSSVAFDRSYKAKFALFEGSLVKSQVASAAQLVAYSGFSGANYLREPYSADLDFGTGEWSCSAWVNVPLDLATASWPSLSNELNTGTAFQNWTQQGTGVSIDAGTGVLTLINPSSTTPVYRSLIVTVGKTYLMTITVDSVSGGAIRLTHSGGAQTAGEVTAPGTYTFTFTRVGGDAGLGLRSTSTSLNAVVSAISVKEVAGTLTIADRAHSSGASIKVGVVNGGFLTATAFDGTTTRTVTTTAAYNTGTWLKARANYTTDGTLAILVNGVEVAATRGNPLLTLNNSNAVLTIGNSFALDAPFPGSLALVKFSATVPTAEQAVWMYEQEKQMFREGAQVCLPDAGNIADLAYDDATDKWIAVSAANESEWSGLVRTSVTPVPAGSYTRTVARSGVQLLARSTTNPGVDITIPAYGLREELVNRSEAAARMNAQLATYDYAGGFTATTVTGNTAITAVAGITYPVAYIGARISGSGIPANTTIVAVSGTTIYLSAAATASASAVAISFVDFILPVGMEAREVSLAGVAQREGATAQYTRLFDGFKETIRFGTAPSNTALIQIQAARSAA